MAHVYFHYRLDKDEVFYVGIGKANSGDKMRAYDTNKRSKAWKGIVKKYGLRIEIVHTNIAWSKAIELEKEYISKFGRKDLGTGSLCNFTDGGEGCLNFKVTDEYREKISRALKGKVDNRGEKNPFYGKKHTRESVEKRARKLIESGRMKGGNNPNYGKPMSDAQKENLRIKATGRKHSEESKIKIRAWGKGKAKSEEWKQKVTGKRNGFYGKGYLNAGELNPRARRCILIETGEIFNCLKEACKEKGLSYYTQRIYLNPKHKRHSNRKFNYLN